MHCFYFITFRYWLHFEISDHTTRTTCSIFDDEAKRILKIIVPELLDLLQGNNSEVTKVIQELYGKSFIFRFKLNERNLTEERQGYLVTRTFIPDDVLEEKFKNDQNNKVRDIFS
jgi:C4-type Zn-finger protein